MTDSSLSSSRWSREAPSPRGGRDVRKGSSVDPTRPEAIVPPCEPEWSESERVLEERWARRVPPRGDDCTSIRNRFCDDVMPRRRPTESERSRTDQPTRGGRRWPPGRRNRSRNAYRVFESSGRGTVLVRRAPRAGRDHDHSAPGTLPGRSVRFGLPVRQSCL